MGKGFKAIFNRIGGWLKRANPIILLAFIFGIIPYLTVGEYTLWNQLRYSRQIRHQQQEITRLEREIATSQKSLEALQYKDEALERYARERYQLKADDEDLYLIE